MAWRKDKSLTLKNTPDCPLKSCKLAKMMVCVSHCVFGCGEITQSLQKLAHSLYCFLLIYVRRLGPFCKLLQFLIISFSLMKHPIFVDEIQKLFFSFSWWQNFSSGFSLCRRLREITTCPQCVTLWEWVLGDAEWTSYTDSGIVWIKHVTLRPNHFGPGSSDDGPSYIPHVFLLSLYSSSYSCSFFLIKTPGCLTDCCSGVCTQFFSIQQGIKYSSPRLLYFQLFL